MENPWSPRAIMAYLVFLVAMSTSNATSCEECGWVLHESACYWISSDVDSLLSWDEAKVVCERRQSTLASINNENHAFFIEEMRTRTRIHWLGFYKPAGQDAFEYLDGSVENPYLAFRDVDRNLPSAEKKSEDCAGIEYSDSLQDIWWADEKCNKKLHYICVKRSVNNVTSTTNGRIKTTTATTTSTMTKAMTENFTKMAALSIGTYKPKKIRTAPPTSDTTSVITGISAIVIIVGVIAFLIGNDVTSVLCQMTVCPPKRQRVCGPDVFTEATSHVIVFKLEQEDPPKELDLFVRFQNHYCCAVKPTGQLINTQNLDAAYLIQNRSNLEIWVRHMAIGTINDSLGQAQDRGNLDLEHIILDHLTKPPSPGKHCRFNSISDSQSNVCHSPLDPGKNRKPIVEGVYTSSPVSVAGLIGSGRHAEGTESRTSTTGATYRSNKRDRPSLYKPTKIKTTLGKTLDSDVNEPAHALFVCSRPSFQNKTDPSCHFKKPLETSMATYVGPAKTKRKPPKRISAAYLGTARAKPFKESSAKSGFCDEFSS